MTDTQGEVVERFKLALIGDCGVGKSSLLTRFVDGTYTDINDCLVGTSDSRPIELDGKSILLHVYDTSALPRWRRLLEYCYRHADGIMLIYNVTCQESMDDVNYWLEQIHLRNKDMPVVLVGNHGDETTNKVVEYNTAKEFADLHGIPFIETSAKDGTNVEQAFITLAAVVKNMKDSQLRGHGGTPNNGLHCCLI